VKRVRPKLMTVMAAMMGLMPIMWSMGTGADVMKRVAAPMVGGLATSFLLELLVYPAVYLLWKKRELRRELTRRRSSMDSGGGGLPGPAALPAVGP
jgi:Cu(I)/Ag(I) efflux system membrane protein CusA/SilA